MTVTTDEYFGGCPECGQNDGYLNLERSHVFFCEQHKVAWLVGANLFSSWREESEKDWERNKAKLASFRKVNPIHPEPTEEEREAAVLNERQGNQAKDFIRVVRALHRLGKVWFFDEGFVKASRAAISSILATQPGLVVEAEGEVLTVDREGGLRIGDFFEIISADAAAT